MVKGQGLVTALNHESEFCGAHAPRAVSDALVADIRKRSAKD